MVLEKISRIGWRMCSDMTGGCVNFPEAKYAFKYLYLITKLNIRSDSAGCYGVGGSESHECFNKGSERVCMCF
ncbi:hypothetical protein Peur_055464 [Populus x canadensis]